MDLTKIKMISGDFDRVHHKLKLSLEGKFGAQSGLETETVEAISKLAEAVDRVDQEMKILKSSLQGSEPISHLKLKIQVALERKEAVTLKTIETGSLLSTPLKSTTLCNFEVEDFPTTPTLEGLGLSGRTLSIVGRRGGFDSSASLSDGEFDNSFYQKSPIVAGVDNSFSSDVSVPNFGIFNSSPVTGKANKIETTRRGKSHNLKQVTTVSSVLDDFGCCTSEDVHEEPLNKKVHFMEEVENEIINK